MLLPKFLAIAVAPLILVFFSLVTAYVLRLGVKGSGIHFDYILFALYVVAALVIGGAI